MNAGNNPGQPENRFRIWKFLAAYIGLMGLFLLLISLQSVKALIDINGIYTRMVVRLSAALMAPFGIVRGIDGSIIRLEGLSLNVLFGCNGLEAFLITPWRFSRSRPSRGRKFWGSASVFWCFRSLT